MPRLNHIKRRPGGMYVVRLVVPAWLRPAAGQRELHRTTGCRDLTLAKVVAAEIIADWHRTLARFRAMDPTKLKVGAVELLGDGEVALTHAARALGADPKGLLERLLQKRSPVMVRVANLPGWRIPDISALHDGHDIDGNVERFDQSPATLERNGDRHCRTGLLKLHLPEEVTAVARSAVAVSITLFTLPRSAPATLSTGFAAFVADDPGLAVTLGDFFVRRRDVESLRQTLREQISEVDLEAMVVASALPSSIASFDSIAKSKYADKPVSELAEKFLMVRAREVQLDEQRRQRDACSALIELTDNVKLGNVDRALIRAVGNQLAQVPANRQRIYGKHNIPEASRWRKLIEIGAQENLPKLTANAVKLLLEDIQAIFAWGDKEGWLRENPADNLAEEFFRLGGGKRQSSSSKRDAFSDDDLQKMFSVEWFRDGVGTQTAEGKFHSYRPHYYWLPLMGLLTGGRINELSQLYLEDIRHEAESGNWYIDINKNQLDKRHADDEDDDDLFSAEARATPVELGTNGGKRLKTLTSARVVPLHPLLIELGLTRYCEALVDAGHVRLFPELKFDAAKGYGKSATKWFGDSFLKRRMNMPRDGRKVFHSFRHNFVTALDRAQAPIAAVKQLVGHADAAGRSADVTDGYTKGRKVAELAPVIGSLLPALPTIAAFNVEQGLRAVVDAIRLKRSHVKTSLPKDGG